MKGFACRSVGGPGFAPFSGANLGTGRFFSGPPIGCLFRSNKPAKPGWVAGASLGNGNREGAPVHAFLARAGSAALASPGAY